jgi:hypothetical protein
MRALAARRRHYYFYIYARGRKRNTLPRRKEAEQRFSGGSICIRVSLFSTLLGVLIGVELNLMYMLLHIFHTRFSLPARRNPLIVRFYANACKFDSELESARWGASFLSFF